MSADPSIGDLDLRIEDLRRELIAVEDWHNAEDWVERSTRIEAEIRRLERERDLLPHPSARIALGDYR